MRWYIYLIICLFNCAYIGAYAQSGNVGIGTSDPNYKLHVNSSQPAMTLESNLPLNISAGSQTISSIIFRGQKNNRFRDAAYIRAIQNGTWSASYETFAPTSLQFFTQSPGNVDGLVSPRMVITSRGNLGVGEPYPRTRLHVTGGSAGTFSSSRATLTLIESDTANYVSLFNPEAYASGIHFGFPSDITSGGLLYNATNTPLGLQFRTNGNASRMVIDNEGKVGIGTTSPKQRLHIYKGSAGTFGSFTNTTAMFESDTDNYVSLMSPTTKPSGITFGNEFNAASGGVIYNSASTPNGLQFRTNGNTARMSILSNGEVVIGTFESATGHKLSIDGKVACEEVRVQVSQSWPDYVFKEDYPLNKLDDVQNYIDQYGHLPGVPSAEKVEENGLEVGEMQRIMVEKIEELTLYILEQNERVKALEEELENLKNDKK